MKTIKEEVKQEIEIKNSRFICYIIPLKNKEIKKILEQIKTLHPKATHYTYAYIYDGIKKSFDDKEPTGTAGAPILNVLEKEELNQVIAVVVRYFGGIKLGAGGLIRAYTKAVTETLKLATYTHLIPAKIIEITYPYEEDKKIKYLLKDAIIIEEKYEEKIHILAKISNKQLENLKPYPIKILEETTIKEPK